MEKNENVREKFGKSDLEKYKKLLEQKKLSLFLKKIFDVVLAFFLLLLFSPIIIIISVWIKLDSEGEIFYRQKRITTNGREFRIFKFRTMVKDADKLGSAVTLQNDPRISKVGRKLRKLRLDELPQLINVLIGDMSFVGARPEVEKYVLRYTDEMFATLLLPAGITSTASIEFKDEDDIIAKYKSDDVSVDDIYIEKVLPEKMKYNLAYLENFSFLEDIKIMFKTVLAVIK